MEEIPYKLIAELMKRMSAKEWIEMDVKDVSLKVFNIMGEEVMQQSNSNEINLSDKPKGIYSCFPHFLKMQLARPYFIEIVFENGCCKPIFDHVFKKIEEPIWQYISADYF